MEVFKINKIVFDFMDMRLISVLKDSCKIIELSLKNGTLNNNIEYFQKVSDLIKSFSLKLEKFNIDDDIIKSNLEILLNLDGFEIKTYLESLRSFLNRIDLIGNIAADNNDNTLNKEFNINIHSRISDKELNLKFMKTENGWKIYNHSSNKWNVTNKSCEEYLPLILKNSSINFPDDLGGYLKWLWDISTVYNLTENEVSEEFEELSKWINLCNDYSPNTRLGGYK